VPADSSCKIMKKIPPERCINDNHFIQFKVTLHRASGHLPALVSFRAFSLAISFSTYREWRRSPACDTAIPFESDPLTDGRRV